MIKFGITCLEPSLAGLSILVFATPANSAQSVQLTFLPAQINVRLDEGQGATYRERDFTGTGVTGFDPALGAQFDTTLTETTPANGKPGTLGNITRISGKIDCGSQTAGSSTIRLTGAAAEGTLDSGLDPVRVRCISTAQGEDVSITAIAQVATTPVFIILTSLADSFTVAIFGNGVSHFYQAKGPGISTVTKTGVHVDGDAVEFVTGGAQAHTVHATGDGTCGT
jgi:hypothetical protein